MASYSSFDNDDNNRYELTVRPFTGKICMNSTERKLRSTNRSQTLRTVRYINSAIRVEREYNNVEENSDSSESSQEMNVPKLEIKSTEEESYSNNVTYSLREIQPLMLKRPDNAFKEWLSAKKHTEKQKHLLKLKSDIEMEKEKQSRYEEAQSKYNNWYREKAIKEKCIKKIHEKQNEYKTSDQKSTINESKANYNAWLKKKLIKEKAENERKIEENKRKKAYHELRRKTSTCIYEKWLETAPNKPKPVPLNRGFYSLKGSISHMFVNPNAWVGD